jgi:glycopeptide antibiotics resistance protein
LKLFFQFLFLTLLAMVLYLGFRPSPAIVTAWVVPRWMGVWFDHHDTVKNLFGFFVVALAGFMAWPQYRWRIGLSIAILIVSIEIIQRWMPYRVSDYRDIIAGWGGIAFAWAAAAACRRHPCRLAPRPVRL